MPLPARADIWQPLDPAKRQIRLLELQPSTDLNENPRGHLVTKSLDGRPAFDALSYAWGGSQDSKPLYIDSCYVPLTESLHRCLRYLRDTRYVRTFWIDAVCINQFDTAERSQQVQQMEHTFRAAEVVRAWIGDFQSDRMPKVFRIVELLAKDHTVHDFEHHRQEITPEDVMNCTLLTRSTWFQRLWVRQEVALARQVVLHYNDVSLDFSVLAPWITKSSRRFSGIGKTYDDVQSALQFQSRLTNLHLAANLPMWIHTRSPAERGENIISFMATCRQCQAQDARDRIFGIYGIFSNAFHDQALEVDYHASPQQVYTEFAISFIRVTRSLTILSQANSEYNALDLLPSWVPDWSSMYDFSTERLRIFSSDTFSNASGGHQVQEPVVHTGGKICLKGYVFDRVKHVSSACNQRLGEMPSEASRAEEQRFLSMSEQISKQYFGILPPSYARTVFRNMRYRGDGNWVAIASDDEATEVMERAAPLMNNLEFAFSRDVTTVVDALAKSRFLITSGARMGMGPIEIQEGDYVAILAGGKVAYALRRFMDASGSYAYTFVGQCYVDSVMDGQLLSSKEFPGFGDIYIR
jgi:hypothetical protein